MVHVLLNLRKSLFFFAVLGGFFFWNSTFASAASYTGQYWNWGTGPTPSNPTGSANLTRTDADINFDWGEGTPGSPINTDNFYVRWTKTENLAAGNYTFTARADDGVRVYVDDTLVINAWVDQGPTTYTGSIDVAAGSHEIKVEYYENGGGAVCQVSYDSPPVVSALSPLAGATAVSPSVNLVINFDQSVSAVAGKNIIIKNSSSGSTIETIAANDTSKVTVSSATVTINPATVLDDLTGYYVLIDSGAFKDGSNKIYAGMSTVSDWSFTTGDTTPPIVSTLSPADSATGVSPSVNLVLAFNENITAVAGNKIKIKKVSDNSEVEVIAVGDSEKVTITNNTASINPVNVFDDVTDYYVLVESGAFKDLFNNSFAGISDSSVWRFTTGDSTAPTVVSLDPVNGSLGVELNKNLVIEFSENINIGSGNVSIFNKTTDELVEAVDVTSGQVTGGGTSIITINPTSNLVYGTNYYIRIDSTAFTDSSSNAYSGLSDNTSWMLQTMSAPASVVESNSSSNSPKKLPDPVHVVNTKEGEVKSGENKILSKIEVEQDEFFILRVKAPDPDQVKNVVVTIDKKKYKLTLKKDKKDNPEFFVKLALSKPGNYPYSIVSDYGSTVRRGKGEVVIKTKPVVIMKTSPKPIIYKKVVTKAEPSPVELKKIINSGGEKNKVEKKTETTPTISTKTSETSNPSSAVSKETTPKETWIDLTFNLFKTTGSKTTSVIINTSRSLLGLFTGTGEKIAKIFEKEPAHVYRKVTVKLVSAEGAPLVGATVTISSEPQTAISDDGGRVQFENIEAGKHHLKVDYQGYSSDQTLKIIEPVTEVTINVTAVFKK